MLSKGNNIHTKRRVKNKVLYRIKNLELSSEVEQLKLKLTFEKDLAAANTLKLEQKNQKILSLRNQLSDLQKSINDQQTDRKIHNLCQPNEHLHAEAVRLREIDSIKEKEKNWAQLKNVYKIFCFILSNELIRNQGFFNTLNRYNLKLNICVSRFLIF